ncbi:MAG: integron integrase [Verrucomicrobiota bacterium]
MYILQKCVAQHFLLINMIPLPNILEKAFLDELEILEVPHQRRAHWQKWARYYIDFSLKYGYSPRDPATLDPFLAKLAAKNQGTSKQAEAAKAVTLLRQVMQRFPAPLPEVERHPNHKKSKIAEQTTPLDHYPVHGKNKHQIAEAPDNSENILQPNQAKPGASWEFAYQKLADILAVKQYALATRRSYTHWIKQFQSFVASVPPDSLDSSQAARFLTHLASKKRVGASTQNQAFNALLFFFKKVLNRDFQPEGVTRARRTKYVPQILTREEIGQIAEAMPPPYTLLTKLLYGCGLRLTEALTLRVHNFDFEVRILTVHRGKGQKDRTVPLPEVLVSDLRSHLADVRDTYESDLAAGFAGAFMPVRGSQKKWDQLATQWQWQFFFPAKRLTKIKKDNQSRRYHLHSNRFSQLLREAVTSLGTHKKVSAHTFRHSFASHLLMANYDIKTIQEMLGHSDVRTTMIYLQTVPSRTKKDRQSPLDISFL